MRRIASLCVLLVACGGPKTTAELRQDSCPDDCPMNCTPANCGSWFAQDACSLSKSYTTSPPCSDAWVEQMKKGNFHPCFWADQAGNPICFGLSPGHP